MLAMQNGISSISGYPDMLLCSKSISRDMLLCSICSLYVVCISRYAQKHCNMAYPAYLGMLLCSICSVYVVFALGVYCAYAGYACPAYAEQSSIRSSIRKHSQRMLAAYVSICLSSMCWICLCAAYGICSLYVVFALGLYCAYAGYACPAYAGYAYVQHMAYERYMLSLCGICTKLVQLLIRSTTYACTAHMLDMLVQHMLSLCGICLGICTKLVQLAVAWV
jgi:hypothetical protein